MADVPSNLIPTTISNLPEAPVASADSLLLIVYQGNNYKVRAGDLLQVAGVPVTRQVIAGTGLTGGGQLANNVTLSVAPGGIGSTELANSGVTPGVYGSAAQVPVFTVDAKGRVTAAGSVPVSVSGYVPVTREVIAGAGLTGGGPLNTNVTLSANLSNTTPQLGSNAGSAGVSTAVSRADHVHPAVDLSDQTQINGVLPIDQGGTGRSLTMQPGAVVWSGADGLYVSTAGTYGQVLVSGGANAPLWASLITDVPLPAHYVYIGPASGPNATPTYRLLVNDDLPVTLSGKTLTGATVTGSTIDSSVIGGSSPAAATFTTVNATDVNATTVDTTNLEVTNLKAKDGTAAGSIANLTGVVTLNSSVLTTADINGGTIDGTVIGGSTPNTGAFTQVDVDNLRLDGSTLSSTNTDGNINIDPSGTGAVNIPAPVTNPTYIQMGSGSGTALAAGRMWYDQVTGSLNFGMGGGNITQQVGEEFYRYGKASSAISDVNLQLVYKTGVVGASGVITFAPAVAGITDPDQIIGIATETIPLNGFGRVTTMGVVRGINTTGTVYGEVWADNDDIWYNPVTGGLTKTKPSAPNLKLLIGTVINAGSGGSGSFNVHLGTSSTLGGTDTNVQFGPLNNNDLIVYNSSLGYWTNAAQSSIVAGSATNLAGGTANQLLYQTGAGVTSFITAPTVANTYLEWSGSAFQWSSNPLGAVTSVGLALPAEFTVSNSPVTGSGTLTGAWASQTANYFLAAPNGTAGTPSFRALVAADVPTLNQNTTGQAGSVANAVTFTTTGGAAAGATFNGSAARTVDYSTVGAPKADGTGASGTWSISINGNAATATSATSATNATNAINFAVTDDTSTNATMYPVWVTANTGNLPARVTSTKLSFNPSTGALTATGGISGGTF